MRPYYLIVYVTSVSITLFITHFFPIISVSLQKNSFGYQCMCDSFATCVKVYVYGVNSVLLQQLIIKTWNII